ncbi:MAG: hypothetical protein J0H00_13730 [Burkholderiales bacterium]|nr:hypothetical protein [Burkholderiales bacterium]OJX09276.1 MAG: hypothetical protein BGO72_20620 [Burkholderiales bacterium 70-64]
MSATVLEMWQDFERCVMSPGIGQIQRQEMRRAFYAGAMAAFVNIVQISSSGDQAVATAELRALVRESEQYVRDLRDGKA